MTTRAEYVALATSAYDKFVVLQERITKIEQRALKRFGNSGVASYQLKTATEYWLYRDLCNDRDIQMKIAQLSASLAAIAHGL